MVTERGNIVRGRNIPQCCRDYRLTGRHLKTCLQHRQWLQFMRDQRKAKGGQRPVVEQPANDELIADISAMTDGGYSMRPNPDSWNPDAKHDKAQDLLYGPLKVTVTLPMKASLEVAKVTVVVEPYKSDYRDDPTDSHPLFSDDDHGASYRDGQRWRAGIPKAKADGDNA